MRKRVPVRAGGFTLIELLVIIAIVMVLALFTWPALDKMIHRARLQGFATEVAGLMNRARLESVKRSVPAVVRLDFASDQVVLFVDVDGDGVFTPDAAVPLGQADFEVVRRPRPARIAFQGPSDGEEGSDAVDGFTVNPEDNSLPHQAVFNPDGSIDVIGAFRFADIKGNVLEVRVAPQATARIELRKWDGSVFRAPREGGEPWNWNV
jgi:type II secretory pathway pseudopilin PulG